MTKIKICGLMNKKDALAAAEAGADFIGMVFAQSRRRVTLKQAKEIVEAVRGSQYSPQIVGVFANQKSKEVNEIACECGFDRVQLSGDENWAYCREIEFPLIKVIRVPLTQKIGRVLAVLDTGKGVTLKQEPLFLLDSRVEGAYGGTGIAFDWQLAKEVASRVPVIVAGGLNAENVGMLMKRAEPWGVDVSSGVETDGRKDVDKIRAFIKAVMDAERSS